MAARAVLATMALAVAVLTSLFTVPAASADDHQTAIDQKVTKSMVWISIEFTGYMLIPWTDGAQWSDAAKVDYLCSGFVVDPAGFIATAGHCVDEDESVMEDIRAQVATNLINSGQLDPSQKDDFLAQANAQEWKVEGKDYASPPARDVEVIQPEQQGRVIDHWMTARVVDLQKFDDGDNALLNVSGLAPLTPLVVSQKVPQPGQGLTAVGFPGAVDRATDQTRIQQPSFKSGTASSQQVSPNGVPSTEVNADLSGGMSGGPTIDNDTGEVLGVNSYTLPAQNAQALNFITNAPMLRSFLQKNGVQLATEPAPAKKTALWLWIAIGVAGLVTLTAFVTMALWLTRRRRNRKSAQPVQVGVLQQPQYAPAQYVVPQQQYVLPQQYLPPQAASTPPIAMPPAAPESAPALGSAASAASPTAAASTADGSVPAGSP